MATSAAPPGRCDPRRTLELRGGDRGAGPVIYWMSRDQRSRDNWALLHAQDLALAARRPLVVAFALAPAFLGATWRQYAFMLEGLKEVESDLAALGIGFRLLTGEPPAAVAAFARREGAQTIVSDFDPLRVKRGWVENLCRRVSCPVVEVDAHNIVPCRIASPKLEFGAYTLRPKLRRLLGEFLTPFARVTAHPWNPPAAPATDWDRVAAGLKADRGVGPVEGLKPGPAGGEAALRRFVADRLAFYDEERNDPVADGQSNLSPWLHFGHLAPQRAALDVRAVDNVPAASRDAFLEELIVRRELSDNFCFYNPSYDAVAGFHAWARATLDAHRADPRERLYGAAELDAARTHDPLWNAAQTEMTRRGKMHGYMRMYWGKKLLEWTPSPEEALRLANLLNDRYALDGRDPNGYTGTAWCIGGVHDRAWGERPVFGKIRYMNDKGCKRKFDVAAYVRKSGSPTS